MFFYFVYVFKNQNRKFLWLDKTFFSCSCLWFSFPTREVCISWQNVCFYCFVYKFKIHKSFNCKNGTDKIPEDSYLDESSKLKMPHVRWNIGISDKITLKSKLGNVWLFENSYFAPWNAIKHHVKPNIGCVKGWPQPLLC